jgi:Spy/CpxP family protein refolding chaperone
MIMKKLAMACFTVLFMTALAVSAFAVGPGLERGHGGGQCNGGSFYRGDIAAVPGINLTDEQTAKIAALREARMKDIKPLKDKLFSKRGDLKLLWLKTNPDQNKILATQKEIRVLKGQIQDRVTKYRLSALKVLTPEQQDKIRTHRQDSRFGAGHKKFGFAKRLNLSNDQLAKMKELRTGYHEETKVLRQDLAMKRLEMRKLFTDPKTDETTLLAKQKELSTLSQQLRDKKAQMKIEWRKILTPEQIAKLDRMPHRPGAMGRGMKDYHRQHHNFDNYKQGAKSEPSVTN